ncbi:MAG TPA: DUF6526 family protein [Bryobacteraceae bacterium]|nr:DUF6526 family protein [Bryobacteraceae bacterium]
MAGQNYANHKKFVAGFHAVLFALIVLTLIGSLVNLWHSLGDHQRLYSASLIVVLDVIAMLLFWYCRAFPLKAQDRAIRAEENLRHFAMTGKLLDARLTIRQIIALRFAPDEEFPALARQAAEEGLNADSIKRAVKNWRGDYHRL